MKKIINLHIEKLPEGVYLATSDDVQGLVVQEDTIEKVIASAREVAKMLLEMQYERGHRTGAAVQDIAVKTPLNIPLQLAAP